MLHCMHFCVHKAEYKYVCILVCIYAVCNSALPCARYFLNLFFKSLVLKDVNEDGAWPSGFLTYRQLLLVKIIT